MNNCTDLAENIKNIHNSLIIDVIWPNYIACELYILINNKKILLP